MKKAILDTHTKDIFKVSDSGISTKASWMEMFSYPTTSEIYRLGVQNKSYRVSNPVVKELSSTKI